MRKVILTSLTLIASLLLTAQDVDVLHYRFFVEVSDKNDTVRGLAAITFVAKKVAPTISLDLVAPNATGKGMRVVAVYGAYHPDSIIPFRQDEKRLLFAPSNLKANDTFEFLVGYKGIPADGLIISKNKFGDRTFFADNWPNRAHHWLPCNDRPDDKATFEFRVTSPLNYTVVSNGIPNGTKILKDGLKITTWTENIPSPTKVMVIGVAKFATKVYEDSPNNVPVTAWVYPQDSAKGFYDYAITPSILKFFADYVGPYPYKKLANVQSKTIFGGMENASCIFYAESSVTGDRRNEDLMAHEIAHQWFGDMVSEKSFAHVWLSEGFATYFTNFYFEKKYGAETAAKRWQKEREEAIAFSKTTTHPVVDSTTNLMSLLNANSYQKGAWVLRMLRQEVGDTVFQKIIQTYYNAYKGGNAETRDFEAIAEKVSGKELTWFFDQWLYRPGVPRLETKVVTKNGGQFLSISQRQAALFEFNLEIAVASRFNKTLHFETVRIKKRDTLLQIPNGAKASLDPQGKLLYSAE